MKIEIELQTKMDIIPTLIPTDTLEIIKKILNDENELEEHLTKNGYINYFIEQFDCILPKGDDRLKLLDNEFYRLYKEKDYEFCNTIFEKNGSKVFLFSLGIDFSDIGICLDKIERLDRVDQYIVFNIYKTFKDSEMYLIDNKILFEFFIKGFLREAISGILYFEELEVFLSYGYDMSLPIFLKDDRLIEEFKSSAKKHKLYIRK